MLGQTAHTPLLDQQPVAIRTATDFGIAASRPVMSGASLRVETQAPPPSNEAFLRHLKDHINQAQGVSEEVRRDILQRIDLLADEIDAQYNR
ncbi:MAG: hypothetical protein AAF998_09805 [Bacteroidota bacterium]